VEIDENTHPLWGIVLAGGDGSRLSRVTAAEHGYPRPKQFCNLLGPNTMLVQTIARADLVVPRERMLVSTTRRWREEAEESLMSVPGVLVSEQPANAGTTPAVVLGLMQIMSLQADARVLIVPADHEVDDDLAYAEAIWRAARHDAPDIVLFGASPGPGHEGGDRILPLETSGNERFAPVEALREWPGGRHDHPQSPVRGELVDTSVLVADARSLVGLVASVRPDWASACRGAVERGEDLDEAYRTLPASDLSRDVLRPNATALHAARFDGVDWSDIGTPESLSGLRGASGGGRTMPT